MKPGPWILVVLVAGALAGLALAQSGGEDFQARWKRLTKNPDKVFKVSARPGEEIPEATLNLSFGPGSLVAVSRGKSRVPDMLEDNDIVSVVNRNLRTVKYCYCKALKQDPEFEGEAVVEMKIRTSGKVARVDIEPEDMAEHHFGKCLGPQVAKWRFPKFTGKKEDGLRVKSIGYEFPLEFNQAR